MKTITYLLLTMVLLLLIASCNPCKEAKNNARNNTKDTALMYLWKYTDAYRISTGVPIDTGYKSFKPNGDFSWSDNLKYIDYSIEVWFTEKNFIKTIACYDNGATDSETPYKYLIRNDSLFLYDKMGNGSYSEVPKVLIKVNKYPK